MLALGVQLLSTGVSFWTGHIPFHDFRDVWLVSIPCSGYVCYAVLAACTRLQTRFVNLRNVSLCAVPPEIGWVDIPPDVFFFFLRAHLGSHGLHQRRPMDFFLSPMISRPPWPSRHTPATSSRLRRACRALAVRRGWRDDFTYGWHIILHWPTKTLKTLPVFQGPFNLIHMPPPPNLFDSLAQGYSTFCWIPRDTVSWPQRPANLGFGGWFCLVSKLICTRFCLLEKMEKCPEGNQEAMGGSCCISSRPFFRTVPVLFAQPRPTLDCRIDTPS